MISVAKSLGIIRNKTYLLTEYKLAISQKRSKHSKRDSESEFLLSFHSYKYTKAFFSSDQKTQSLLSGKMESSTQAIELTPGQKTLPPQWIDVYEDTQQKLKDLQILYEEIRKLSGKRKMAVSDKDIRRIDQDLHDQTGRVTKKISECEKNLTTIKLFASQTETQNDLQVRINIQKSLAQNISDQIQKFRKQQKSLFDYLKNVQGEDLGFLQRAAENKLQMKDDDDEDNEGQLQSDIMMEEIDLERDQEINQLIESINELTYLFKALNTMVIEQGTILDRIDYNIEKAFVNTKQANVQLKKADEYQKSPRAKYCMLILLVLIAVFSILVIIKFSK